MIKPFMFIGVVSYERSAFVESQGNQGLAVRLQGELGALGLTCECAVDTQDRFDPVSSPIRQNDVQESLSAQLDIAAVWTEYLRGNLRVGLRDRVTNALRLTVRQYQRLRSPNPSTLVRLLNIEMAHRALLEQGVNSGAPWILILEDDAYSTDVADLALGLHALLAEAFPTVAFINLSDSFSLHELGVDHLVTDTGISWKGTSDRLLLQTIRPVTNTVCAIAYRSTFAKKLLQEFDAMPMRPVVPIDWKLNAALMAMTKQGELGFGSTWWIHSGPIDQMSMRGTP